MCSVRVLGSSLSDTSLSHQTRLGVSSQTGFLEATGARIGCAQKPLGAKEPSSYASAFSELGEDHQPLTVLALGF